MPRTQSIRLPLRLHVGSCPGDRRGLVWQPGQCCSCDSSISSIPLLSPFTQIQWKKLPFKLHCSQELLLSAVKASELLLRGRGQVNSTLCKITPPPVKYGLTLTHWIYLEIYLERLCGFGRSVLEFALQAQDGGPAIPQGTALRVELGGYGQLFPTFGTPTIGTACSSPALPWSVAESCSPELP